MARKNYKSYGNHSLSNRHRRRNIQWFIVAVVVLIVLLSILLKTNRGKEPIVNDSDIETINPVLPDNIEIVEMPKSSDKEPEVPAEPVIALIEPKEDDVKPSDQPKDSEMIAIIDKPLSEAGKRIKQAYDDLQKSDYVSARDTLNEVLSLKITPQERSRVKKQMARLSEVWMKVAFPGDRLTGSYKVRSGDNLEAIGKRYKVPAELLMKINGISDPKRLQAEQNLKVVNGPFHAIIYKSSFELDLYLQNTYVKTYKVGIGLPGKETPAGKWRVEPGDGKLVRPDWPRPQEQGGGLVKPDDPEYPLGSRWIALEGIDENTKGRIGFGIHGTKDPESIGKRSSLGCVRLYNGDVVEFYDMVVPGLSRIYIRE